MRHSFVSGIALLLVACGPVTSVSADQTIEVVTSTRAEQDTLSEFFRDFAREQNLDVDVQRHDVGGGEEGLLVIGLWRRGGDDRPIVYGQVLAPDESVDISFFPATDMQSDRKLWALLVERLKARWPVKAKEL